MRISKHDQGIIERFQSSIPVDVVGLAEALGLKVWESSDLPANASGKIVLDARNGGSSGYAILVRSSDSYTRRRFTVAHEIAHFVLHQDRIGDSLVDDALYRSNLSSREEVEANRLAAAMLMPAPELRDHLKQMTKPNVPYLASLFQVSKDAMRIRLENVGSWAQAEASAHA